MNRAIATLTGLAACLVGTAAHGQDVLPRPEQPFEGQMGRTAAESIPDFPQEVSAPKGAPNILLIMTDDVGFSASSTFGGPIPTATMDRLAKAGLRYTAFHTTALSSPTRAALLSGRNHHTAATGVIMELGTGYPGYHSLMPKSCGTFAEVLKQNGWNTAWYGKNHNVPDWHGSQAGPFDLWPTGLGFEYFYGFIGGDANQFAPALVENIKPIEPPHDAEGYHLDKDLADKCIERIRLLNSLAPDKPWVQYYAPGTSHAPHHAPKEWIEKFKGKFDQGWDKVREETLARQKQMGIVPANAKLTPRPESIPAWDSLTADQKKVFARMMEVYAGALAHCDHQIGRVIQAVEELGELDNTLVIYIQGDNGASAEGSPQGLLNELTFFNAVPEDLNEVIRRMDELGGPMTYNHYPVGWALAMDTPFQWTKQIASHFGGTRNGLVISWPAQIKDKGGIRTQFHHVIDIAPTILEACGVQAPAELNGVPQRPFDGVSMVYSFDDAAAPSKRHTQYFEMLGNRGIYHDGWYAATTPPVAPWVVAGDFQNVEDYEWELYNVAEDFSQSLNLADKEPEKLRELQDLFWIEAARYNVIPLDNSKAERFDVSIRPSLTRGRSVFTYFAGQTRIPEGSAPDLKNKSFKIGANVVIPQGGAEGIIATQGGRFNGWGLYLLDSKPVYHYNLAGVQRYTIAAKDKLQPGEHVITLDFAYDGGLGKGGTVTISVDDKPVANGRVERTIPIRVSVDETLDIGEDTGTPVSEDYSVPFKFTGNLKRVLIGLSDHKLTPEDEEEIRRAKALIGVSH
ncbi:MAG: arylsulfatase [Candidatus Abyssobacteria bacterium SURF_17]|uniref:Arylsulfatase n=1 Tax=Candidatus Abyssobacteria bacterium SURF_17 TaxID=2093361 RepID=A0A419ES42_9BACT|nr:MAG: arylsulfatase [Candidatus Abyssubacteria bacterium SURF_17]